jgi:hypothetical protein
MTRVTLPNTDTAALYGFLDQLAAVRAPLVSISRAQPGLEEIFLHLLHDELPGAASAEGSKGHAA